MSKNESDSLGNRMKEYENAYRHYLPRRMPVIIRLDGKAFHSYTKGMEKPFDEKLIGLMNETAIELAESVMGAELLFVQSDEISIFVHNYKKLVSEPWFGNNIQKIVSISAGIASVHFAIQARTLWPDKKKAPVFDSRVFVLPEHELCNYFLWRQRDWERNSIQLLGRSKYSHSEMNNKNNSDVHEMLHQKGVNWNNLPTYQKRGRCILKGDEGWYVDNEIPQFGKDRQYIERYLAVEED